MAEIFVKVSSTSLHNTWHKLQMIEFHAPTLIAQRSSLDSWRCQSCEILITRETLVLDKYMIYKRILRVPPKRKRQNHLASTLPSPPPPSICLSISSNVKLTLYNFHNAEANDTNSIYL
ncbi:uncharacterized protein LOC135161271 [Diachasmimorpha longicaudata]|uniref:uncharacterized protein LOC135161271 n=1 Tax=Diachasmimorpha longicaudata TaxID=58733 RepID=UPI0030B898AF